VLVDYLVRGSSCNGLFDNHRPRSQAPFDLSALVIVLIEVVGVTQRGVTSWKVVPFMFHPANRISFSTVGQVSAALCEPQSTPNDDFESGLRMQVVEFQRFE
jgi:hypothetical protein